MYAKKNFRLLPTLMLLLGGAGSVVRLFQDSFGTDSAGLLIPWHGTTIALVVMTVIAAGVAIYGGATIDKVEGYLQSFPGSLAGAVGHGAAALGIWYTVWPRLFAMEGRLGLAWTVLGLISVVTLAVAGWFRLQGKQPFFLLHLCPTVFLVVHIILHYRLWSSDPQLSNYLFTLIGLIFLVFHSFYHCAFDVDLEWRGKLTFCSLICIFLCLTAIPGSGYPWLFLGGTVWALTDRPAPSPRKRRRRPAMEEVREE